MPAPPATKTASLFSVSCEVGPILANKTEEERKRFAEFGEKVGIAFQIADDLLDFVGDSASMAVSLSLEQAVAASAMAKSSARTVCMMVLSRLLFSKSHSVLRM